jgi:TRAP-type uncharacterized transport system fused permease subunit
MVKRVIISILVVLVVLFASNMFFSVLYPTVTRSTGLEQMKDSNEGIMVAQTTDILKDWFTLIPIPVIIVSLLIVWRKQLIKSYNVLMN